MTDRSAQPTDEFDDVPQCLACGACCHTDNPQLVTLLGHDAVAVPEGYVVHAADGSLHLRMEPVAGVAELVCTALGPKNVCRIYARRPFLCREFERGGKECRHAIIEFQQRRKI